MRIKSVSAPSRTDKLSVGDEWISPDGHTPKFRHVWNGTCWETDLAESGFPLAETGKALSELGCNKDLGEEDEEELEEEDSEKNSEDSSKDSTQTEGSKSEQSVQTALPAGNGRAEKPGKGSKPGKESGVRKGGKSK